MRLLVILSLAVVSCRVAFANCDDRAFARPSELLKAVRAQITEPFLVDGLGCYGEPDLAPCDWETVIRDDRLLSPTRRLLVTVSDHRGGSGAWSSVLVFDCSTRHPRLVLQKRYLYGVTIESAAADKLVLASGLRLTSDPMCCPSAKQRSIFSWTPVRQRFVLISRARLPATAAR